VVLLAWVAKHQRTQNLAIPLEADAVSDLP
jgi:hypothetical protein